KQVEEEEVKAEEEEKRRKEEEEEEKKQQEEKQKRLSEFVTPEDKGKAVAYDHDPLVLLLQEQLTTQKAETEQIKDVKNLTETQRHVLQKQEETN
ncbi:hypothetical protein A2U01_0076125, partial [Trifolium medium]|nr:hypothetical protein [Trifolium medium]